MKRRPNHKIQLNSRETERGFSLIGLLAVLVIIMILSGLNFQSSTGGGTPQSGQTGQTAAPLNPLAKHAKKKVGEVEVGIARIDRAGADACEASMTALKTDMMMISASAMGSLPGPDEMHMKVGHYTCPRGGQYQYDDNGTVYCKKHDPPPAGISVTNI